MVIERGITLIESDGEAEGVQHLDLVPPLSARLDQAAGGMALR
jgi:hypothetical protein